MTPNNDATNTMLIAVPTVSVLRIVAGHIWRTRVLGESWAQASEAMIEITDRPERMLPTRRRPIGDDPRLFDTGELSELEPEAAAEVVERYKSLADIERGFKVLKSEIEIGPVYHRLPERIRAHAQLCFLALILHRVMRSRLQSANTGLSPERALE